MEMGMGIPMGIPIPTATLHICDLWLPPYFYHKDTYRIKFSHFYLLCLTPHMR